jgi:hypothetical protein
MERASEMRSENRREGGILDGHLDGQVKQENRCSCRNEGRWTTSDGLGRQLLGWLRCAVLDTYTARLGKNNSIQS